MRTITVELVVKIDDQTATSRTLFLRDTVELQASEMLLEKFQVDVDKMMYESVPNLLKKLSRDASGDL